jgi:hypothetical protein
MARAVDIAFSVPFDRKGEIEDSDWPESWPIPRVGESIVCASGLNLFVIAVDYFPKGEDDSDPFVYVILRDKPGGSR